MKNLRFKTLLVVTVFCGIGFSALMRKSSAAGTRPAANGPLKVEYASPAPKIAPVRPDPAPPAGKAALTVGNKAISPANYSGRYERVAVRSGQAVTVQLSWPDDNISAGVYADAIQGGKIDGQKSKSFDFRNGKAIRFVFTPDHEAGRYEVLLRRGTTEEVLQFWVPTNHPEKDPHALN
jgi:hypothetical protein